MRHEDKRVKEEDEGTGAEKGWQKSTKQDKKREREITQKREPQKTE